eukprot:COSAG06_NODE_1615_length_8927_cov_12.501699_12_plen_78_part_00
MKNRVSSPLSAWKKDYIDAGKKRKDPFDPMVQFSSAQHSTAQHSKASHTETIPPTPPNRPAPLARVQIQFFSLLRPG